MKLVADRFPGADEIDTSLRGPRSTSCKAYPNLQRHPRLRLQRADRCGQRGAAEAPRRQDRGRRARSCRRQAKPMIMDGTIREGFLGARSTPATPWWRSASRDLQEAADRGRGSRSGLGKATSTRQTSAWSCLNNILVINKQTIDGLIAAGPADSPGALCSLPAAPTDAGADFLELRRHLEAVRRRPGAARRRLGDRAGRGALPGRRERLRQVDADQDHLRRAAARAGRRAS